MNVYVFMLLFIASNISTMMLHIIMLSMIKNTTISNDVQQYDYFQKY